MRSKTTLGMALEELDGLDVGLDDGVLVSAPYELREDFADELCRFVNFRWQDGPVLGVLEFDTLRFEVVPLLREAGPCVEGGRWSWQ